MGGLFTPKIHVRGPEDIQFIITQQGLPRRSYTDPISILTETYNWKPTAFWQEAWSGGSTEASDSGSTILLRHWHSNKSKGPLQAKRSKGQLWLQISMWQGPCLFLNNADKRSWISYPQMCPGSLAAYLKRGKRGISLSLNESDKKKKKDCAWWGTLVTRWNSTLPFYRKKNTLVWRGFCFPSSLKTDKAQQAIEIKSKQW